MSTKGHARTEAGDDVADECGEGAQIDRDRAAGTDVDANEPDELDLTVITGLSGAGKSEAVATFEDMGYFCIDNLPPRMVCGALELFSLEGSRVHQVALVFDARGGCYFDELDQALDYLADTGTRFRLLYLEATDEALVARYQASRRPHPLSSRLGEGIERERQLLGPLRKRADLVVDTTELSPRELRRYLEETLLADRLKGQLFLSLESFGYRYGVPAEADMVMDARFLPNPHWVLELRPLSGLDQPVRKYVVERPEAEEFAERLTSLMRFLAPRFLAEQKPRVVLAVGCTGGRHRSVALVEEVAGRLRDDPEMVVSVAHRDIEKPEQHWE